mgnify:CR=1 FL=1
MRKTEIRVERVEAFWERGRKLARVADQGDPIPPSRVVAFDISVEEGGGSVYADLGYPDSDAMCIKAQLVTKIAEILRKRGLAQAQAAEILGLTQPKVSALLQGRFRGVSERRLLECLTRLGRDVQILVKPAPHRREAGRLTVLFG